MRQIDLTHPNRVPGSEARVARLTRHLRARLLDFGPGGPEVLSADEAAGAVRARFPGHDAAKILDRLAASAGVRARLDGLRPVPSVPGHSFRGPGLSVGQSV